MQVNTRSETTLVKRSLKINTKVSGLDNPSSIELGLNQYLKMRSLEAEFKRVSGLTSEAIDVLTIIVNRYLNNELGSSCYYVANRLNPDNHCEIRNVRFKIDRMISKGYIELLCIMSNRTRLYIPTYKALKELSELVK